MLGEIGSLMSGYNPRKLSSSDSSSSTSSSTSSASSSAASIWSPKFNSSSYSSNKEKIKKARYKYGNDLNVHEAVRRLTSIELNQWVKFQSKRLKNDPERKEKLYEAYNRNDRIDPPLHVAVRGSHFFRAEILAGYSKPKKYGQADPVRKNARNENILHIAAIKANKRSLGFLKKVKENLSSNVWNKLLRQKNSHNRTAYFNFIARNGYGHVTPYRRDYSGSGEIYSYSESGTNPYYYKMKRLLGKHSSEDWVVDPSQKDDLGLTAIQFYKNFTELENNSKRDINEVEKFIDRASWRRNKRNLLNPIAIISFLLSAVASGLSIISEIDEVKNSSDNSSEIIDIVGLVVFTLALVLVIFQSYRKESVLKNELDDVKKNYRDVNLNLFRKGSSNSYESPFYSRTCYCECTTWYKTHGKFISSLLLSLASIGLQAFGLFGTEDLAKTSITVSVPLLSTAILNSIYTSIETEIDTAKTLGDHFIL